jgi:diketogulonate reductase-like aldo/keto reductase
MYANEETLGEAIKAADRSKLYITTKLGGVPKGETIKETLVRSCSELKVDYVDLFLIHSPKIVGDNTVKQAWAQMEEIKESGLAKSVGVSNFRIKDLEEILGSAKIVPAVNQVR